MARKETIIHLEIDTAPIEDAGKDATQIMQGLQAAIKDVQAAVDQVFKDTAVDGFSVDMEKLGKKLDDALLSLRLNFGKLKAAVAEAAVPIGAVLVPVLNQAVLAATRLVKSIGQVLGALFGTAAGTDELTDSAGAAVDAEEALESAAAAAGKAVKRSLAGFDQINRLEAPATGSTGSTGTAQVVPETVTDTLSPQLQAIVEKILELTEPLKNIDLTPLMQALGQLGGAFSGLGSVAGGALEWLWFEILAPLVTWIIEEFAPVFLKTLASALEAVSKAIEPVISGFQLLWEELEPVVAFIGESVIIALEEWKKIFDELARVFEEKGPMIEGIFRNIGEVIAAVWAVVGPILTEMRDQWSKTFGQIGKIAADVIGYIIEALYGVTEFLAGVFTGDWERAWEGICTFLKGIINGIVGFLNTMIEGIVGALNMVIRAVNTLRFTVPDWVPGIGGEVFGFNLSTVTAPQIPYLAKGAVLPANRPFLAMVGDQRHGTNVEAPLATIQEAVALVMDDMVASNLAGQEAIVGVLREILEAVLGIRIGDREIGQAVDRYRRKMAVVKGGYV